MGCGPRPFESATAESYFEITKVTKLELPQKQVQYQQWLSKAIFNKTFLSGMATTKQARI